MARKLFKYFADVDGVTTELTSAHAMRNDEFARRWPTVAGIRYDSFYKWVGIPTTGREGGPLPVTRMIGYKSAPSLHECSGKCLNGNPRATCECKCGGANHGTG